MKWLIFIGMTIGGSVGWWLGEQISNDITIQFLISSVGTFVGIWLGWKAGMNIEG